MKINNSWKLFSLLVFSVFVLILSAFCLYFFAEKYFFDRLFYNKSIRHGYYDFWPAHATDWQIVEDKFNFDHRNTDLINLVKLTQDEEARDYFDQERKKQDFKVALIGDSMFFGLGLRKNQTLAKVLEKKLQSYLPTTVYSFSYCGDDLLDNLIKYQLVEKYLSPDVIVLSLVNNDLIFSQMTYYPDKELLFQDFATDCPEPDFMPFVQVGMVADTDFPTLVMDYYLPSFASDTQNFCFLQEVAKKIDSTKTILLAYRCPTSMADCTAEDEIYCADQDIYNRYLSVFPTDRRSIDFCGEQYLSISDEEGHPSYATNLLLADKILQMIKKEYLNN